MNPVHLPGRGLKTRDLRRIRPPSHRLAAIADLALVGQCNLARLRQRHQRRGTETQFHSPPVNEHPLYPLPGPTRRDAKKESIAEIVVILSRNRDSLDKPRRQPVPPPKRDTFATIHCDTRPLRIPL